MRQGAVVCNPWVSASNVQPHLERGSLLRGGEGTHRKGEGPCGKAAEQAAAVECQGVLRRATGSRAEAGEGKQATGRGDGERGKGDRQHKHDAGADGEKFAPEHTAGDSTAAADMLVLDRRTGSGGTCARAMMSQPRTPGHAATASTCSGAAASG